MIEQFAVFATWLRARAHGDRGSTLVEYALLLALITVTCITVLTILGNSINDMHTRVGQSVHDGS